MFPDLKPSLLFCKVPTFRPDRHPRKRVVGARERLPLQERHLLFLDAWVRRRLCRGGRGVSANPGSPDRCGEAVAPLPQPPVLVLSSLKGIPAPPVLTCRRTDCWSADSQVSGDAFPNKPGEQLGGSRKSRCPGSALPPHTGCGPRALRLRGWVRGRRDHPRGVSWGRRGLGGSARAPATQPLGQASLPAPGRSSPAWPFPTWVLGSRPCTHSHDGAPQKAQSVSPRS